MKRLLLVSLGLFLFAVPSRAQSSADASVGYSYFHLGRRRRSQPEWSSAVRSPINLSPFWVSLETLAATTPLPEAFR